MILNKVTLIDFPKILDPRGNLSFLQNNDQLPFRIQRAYWIYDVPGGQHSEGHAYKNTQEVIIALSGSFDIVMRDGEGEKKITLNRSYYGVYIPKLVWRHLENFSTNSLAFIVTDLPFDEGDYIKNFTEYQQLKK
jgi:oxalate decarboxylase/phosphoglucose isomerase-like protein (cupin superfamily)